MSTVNLSIAALCSVGAVVLFTNKQPGLALAYFGFGLGYLGLAVAS